jgi:hypothetical protein
LDLVAAARSDAAVDGVFVAATFLITPYVLNYDMVIFACIVACCASARKIRRSITGLGPPCGRCP